MTAFRQAFEALSDHPPFRWQERLYGRLAHGHIPTCCDLPTGLGKTAVIPVWLIALANSASEGRTPPGLPRRLVYIVNRRTVVDQATKIVEEIRRRLLNPADARWGAHEEILCLLCRSLSGLAATDGIPVAISTLRGELADNEEWKADPSRPAIIIGTIDMIGSKLLFSGYGDGRYHRAHHAGLIGQDTLIIHDEAHLTPPFSQLLRSVASEQEKARESRPIRIMELSATARGSDQDVLGLEPEDEKDQLVAQRLDAAKHLVLHEVDEKAALDTLCGLALEHDAPAAKVLIYVQSPESAQKVAAALHKGLGNGERGTRVALLTGTIRGHERDLLVEENPVYRTFLNGGSALQKTVYLVSTSAGEVGIDLDADHMVCDLSTLDSMIQRLGRVNRRGGQGRIAQVDVVVERKEADEARKEAGSPRGHAADETKSVLSGLPKCDGGGHDASPRTLRALLAELSDEQRAKAFSPKSPVPPLTDILLDAWALTGIRESIPGRPEVAAYLHGLTQDPPQTYVAWRGELTLLRREPVGQESLRQWFAACRVEARERVRDHTERVRKSLRTLLESHRKRADTWDCAVAVLDERGEAEWARLSKAVGEDFNLAHRTVVLPAEAGGLTDEGTLDGKSCEPQGHEDVADRKGQDRRQRWLLTQRGDTESWQRIAPDETEEASVEVGEPSAPDDALRELCRVTVQAPPEDDQEDDQSRHLLLFVEPQRSAVEDPEAVRSKQTLRDHNQQVVDWAQRIVDRLALQETLRHALCSAAEWHDSGKARPTWQRYACNADQGEPVAKSKKYLHGRALGGYRHEFGSLNDIQQEKALQSLHEDQRDLVLHLIAAHHGYGRPHFPAEHASDPECLESVIDEVAREVPRRFARLQRKYGRWGLAWLESLLRCADIAASKQETQAVTELRNEETPS